MARGRGGKKAYKPSGRPRRPGAGPEEEGSEEEEEEAKFKPRSRGLGAQANTVGMLPPSDDEEEEEEAAGPSKEGEASGDAKPAEAAPSKPAAAPAATPAAAAPSKPAAPAVKKAVAFSESEDDSDEDDSGEDESDDDAPPPKGSTSGQPAKAAPKPAADYLSEQSARKPKGVVEERDPEEIRKEMERLALVRTKREEDRKRRVAAEGWDRFAPVSDTNRPPGTVPTDHPSARA